jgi:hypothetical protein
MRERTNRTPTPRTIARTIARVGDESANWARSSRLSPRWVGDTLENRYGRFTSIEGSNSTNRLRGAPPIGYRDLDN